MDIKQLQYFVTSVDLGSFHAAAEALITTQPNVSKVVKALEEEMGMTLLVRKRSGVTVTAEGEEVYKYALNTLKNFKMLGNLKEKKEERLAVCGTPSNSLAVLVAEFCSRWPERNIRLEFLEGDFEDLVVWIHRRIAELGFTYISKRTQPVFERRLKTKGLEYHELHRTALFLYCGRKNPLFDRKQVTEKDLEEVKLIQRREDIHSLSNHLGVRKGEELYRSGEQHTALTNSDHFFVQLLKNTDYCAIDGNSFKESYNDNVIRAIPIRGSEDSISFGYIKRVRDSLSALMQEFIEYLDTTAREK